MINRIFILLFGIFIFSCQNQEKKDLQKITTQKEIEMEQKILSKYAKDNGYEKRTYEDFKNRCLYYLGISLNDKAQHSLKNINEDIEYQISEEGQYIFTEAESLFYQPNIEGDVTYEQAEKMLYNKENGIGEKFLAYNKLIFNDDPHSVSYFLRHIESNIDIVFNLDYEKNVFLLEKALNDAEKNNIYSDNIENILFYNNKERGFKKALISKIYERNKHPTKIKKIEILLNQFYKDYNTLDYSPKIKDECLVFIIKCLIDYDQNRNQNTLIEKKSYQYLSKFLEKENELFDRIEKKKYYDSNEIKDIINNILSKKEILFIQDPDGYTNLRRGKGTSTEIIQQIKSGESVEVLDNSGEWYLVKTKEGKEGYVHKSRVKPNISKPISMSLYSRPDWNSFFQDIRVEEEIKYIHKVSGWDYVKIGDQLGYLPPVGEEKPIKKHSFLVQDEPLPKKEKNFLDKLFGTIS